jgi:GntR family transcriptional regulator
MDIYSGFVISQTDGRPMYIQIIEQIKQRIAIGDWPPGTEIPSIRQLAVALRVSVITVKRAYFELERDGVITTQHGKGSKVAEFPNVAPRRYDDELTQSLEQVARLGAMLGLSPETLTERLLAAIDHHTKEIACLT